MSRVREKGGKILYPGEYSFEGGCHKEKREGHSKQMNSFYKVTVMRRHEPLQTSKQFRVMGR